MKKPIFSSKLKNKKLEFKLGLISLTIYLFVICIKLYVEQRIIEQIKKQS